MTESGEIQTSVYESKQILDCPDSTVIGQDTLEGAFAGSESLSTEQIWTPDLPLIVWLRGDEPHFGEFTLSADEVMEMLSIKRSRLTQVSGKELRVGRTRIDRYIRPVFRSCDVEEYLGWTRKTASHKKSSEALDTAAKNLESKSDLLTNDLIARTKHLPRETARLISDLIQEANRLSESNQSHNQVRILARLEKSEINQTTLAEEKYHRLKSKIEETQKIAELANESSQANSDKIEILLETAASLMSEIQSLKASVSQIAVKLNSSATTQLEQLESNNQIISVVADLSQRLEQQENEKKEEKTRQQMIAFSRQSKKPSKPVARWAAKSTNKQMMGSNSEKNILYSIQQPQLKKSAMGFSAEEQIKARRPFSTSLKESSSPIQSKGRTKRRNRNRPRPDPTRKSNALGFRK